MFFLQSIELGNERERLNSVTAILREIDVNAVNQKDRKGYTALHYAVQLKQVDIAAKLIQKGAGKDSKTYRI